MGAHGLAHRRVILQFLLVRRRGLNRFDLVEQLARAGILARYPTYTEIEICHELWDERRALYVATAHDRELIDVGRKRLRNLDRSAVAGELAVETGEFYKLYEGTEFERHFEFQFQAKAGRDRTYATWLAAAAALVLAAVIGLRYTPARHGDAPAPAAAGAAVSAGEAVQSIETELRQAEAHYENAIKGLEVIANSEQSELDPRTAATLQRNLAVIDQAISESRAAVRSQPASEPAQQSLIDGFKIKIGLLQDTVALINEMRKGNEAGAARVASGLKQKGT